jgi:chitodextrinase
MKAPGRYWYIAPTRLMAKDIFWSDLKQATHPTWLAEAPTETELRVTFKGGGEIQLYGAEEYNNLRGRKVRGVVFDEFADIRPEAWTEAMRPALADTQGWADFIGTPKSYNHLYDAYLRGQDAADAEWSSWQFRTVDNPFIRPEEVEAARKDMDERTFRQEFEASFEAMAGRIYYAFARTQDVRPVVLDPRLPVCVAFDFNVNPATAVIGQRYQDEARVWREVFITHAGGEATRASATKARDLLATTGYRGPVRIYADATGQAAKTTGPSDHATVRAVFPGASWHVPNDNPHVKDRYAAVNTRICASDGTRRLSVDPSCQKLIADLEQVVFDDKGLEDQKSNPMLTHISSALGYWIWREWPTVARHTAGVANFEHLLV